MGMTNNITISLSSTLTGTAGLVSSTVNVAQIITNALTTDACDLLYSITGTMTGTSDDYDLAGSLETPLGTAAVFAEVMMVFFRNNGDNAMTIGGANNIPILNGTTDEINVAPGAYFLYLDQAGITVTAGTGDLITVTGTATQTYDLIVIGSST